MTQICNAFSLFGCHVIASNLGTSVLTTQWSSKCHLVEKPEEKLLIASASTIHRTERLRLNEKIRPGRIFPAEP